MFRTNVLKSHITSRHLRRQKREKSTLLWRQMSSESASQQASKWLQVWPTQPLLQAGSVASYRLCWVVEQSEQLYTLDLLMVAVKVCMSCFKYYMNCSVVPTEVILAGDAASSYMWLHTLCYEYNNNTALHRRTFDFTTGATYWP